MALFPEGSIGVYASWYRRHLLPPHGQKVLPLYA